MTPLGALERCAQYGPTERLTYHGTVSSCGGVSALLCVPLGSIKSWNALGICRLILSLAVDLVLVLVAAGRLTEIGWYALKDQEWFPYSFDKGRVMMLLSKPSLVRCSARDAEVRECKEREVKQKYREKIVIYGMALKYASLA